MDTPKKLEFFYIRHADTVGASSDGRDSCDIGLSAIGEKQIELLGERFKGMQFDAILSSPLVRCIKTAASVANALKNPLPIEIVPELIEKGSTENYVGCSLLVLQSYYKNLKLCHDLVFGTTQGHFPNTTSEDVDLRAEALSRYLLNRFHYGQRIMIVSHGTFGNHFIPAMLGVKLNDTIISLNNTSVSKIKFTDDGKKRLSFHNDISHLRSIMPEYELTV